MDAFIRANARLLGSAIYLTLGLLVAGYSFLYLPVERQTVHARKFAAVLALENTQLDETKQNLKKAKDRVGVSSVPDFLERINGVAKDTGIAIKDSSGRTVIKDGVIINKLVPRENQKFTFDLQITEDYFKFLRFSRLLETLDVVINDIQVHPYDPGRSPPLHAISFSLTPRNDAVPLSGERLKELQEMVDAPNKRNPFQRFAVGKVSEQVRKEIDLTWIYKLSGIGSIGGVRMATIDGREYEAGGKFEGMTVLGVDADKVNLSKITANGEEKYIIRFRKK
ncbi:MAG: hypothetical protein H7840_01965 [Alphaproteobacteria bacterium]